MRVVGALAAFVLTCSFAAAQSSNEEIFAKANAAYDQNNFDEAISSYLLLLQRGVRQPEVYYNLGTAYFKNDQLGLAVAAYRHSLELDPSFKQAVENLGYIRQYAIDKVEESPRGFLLDIWYGLASIFSAQGFFIFTVAIFWSLSAVISLMLLNMTRRELLTYLLILLASVFILSLALTYSVVGEAVSTRWGVLTVPSTELREGPGEDFEKIFTGHEGLEFKILSERQGYYLVELANGLKGWVRSDALGEI